jgi:hypothetical protein
MVPPLAFHVTVLFVTVPATVALNWTVPPVITEAVTGETVTEVTTGADTVTVAVPDLAVLATLVAVTV